MLKPPLDLAPVDGVLTEYDEDYPVTYLRLLDAAEEGADWCEVSRIVLHRDPDAEPGRTRRAYDSHLARARWMSEEGYQWMLREPG
ncbi:MULTISPECIES: DUF2285 domain-containing protein [unclassified Bradyrhizobium]|uniref:DUF2285 domain-containing protein n=1 Tax=unclassified Bradyrhizobium TaxID=2631580 RepID=UPI002916E098|nr:MULTISPECIES: DUF2285 domain-containing protein [unclassified Bradyrhizobium]